MLGVSKVSCSVSVGLYPPTLSGTVSGSSPFSVQRGAASPVLSSPSQRSAQERAASTTARPGIESEPTALRSSLYESEVRNDSCMDTSFSLACLPVYFSNTLRKYSSRVKYLNNYQMDLHDILSYISCSPEDELILILVTFPLTPP